MKSSSRDMVRNTKASILKADLMLNMKLMMQKVLKTKWEIQGMANSIPRVLANIKIYTCMRMYLKHIHI